MISEELIGGLKNAMERGSTLNQAIQSFINAGYSPRDVEAAAQQINPSSTLSLMSSPQRNLIPLDSNIPINNSIEKNKEENKTPRIVIILIVVLIILIIGFGGLYLFGEDLINQFLP